MKTFIVSVGKTKENSLLDLEDKYKRRLSQLKLEILESKTNHDDLEKESLEIKKRVNEICRNHNPYVILLTERGHSLDSVALSQKLQQTLAGSYNSIVFIIGGAAGFSEDIEKMANYKLSLSSLTFPHQIARMLLIEQLYRSETIWDGHPYHK